VARHFKPRPRRRWRGIYRNQDALSDVPSFGALPQQAWLALGILELVCVVGLIVPAALRWQPALTVIFATILAIKSLVFIGVHVKYRETSPMFLGGVLGLVMAFVAYGRMVLRPIC
jgi:DoxX-like family